ncbi:MAG: hypothetical protein GWP27_10070, partial [Bacteroidetes bacterium]|nr:hypothetical protein [Bacteroidota bacterium]
MYSTTIETWELLLSPIYFGFAALLCLVYPKGEDRTHFTIGLTARIGGGIMYGLIYLFYYGGGDTTAYFNTAIPFLNLIVQDPLLGIQLFFDAYSIENYSVFTESTGFPYRYIYADISTFTVSRIITPFLLFGLKSYFLTTILFSTITYLGTWKLYVLFKRLAPSSDNLALFSALLFPSVLFWGSGISKDTITYTSLAYVVYAFYFTFIVKEVKIWRIVIAVAGALLILLIKPYIFLILFPGALVWVFHDRIQKIRYRFVRAAIVPLTALITALIFGITFSNLSPILGDYSAENILQKALITQDDLKRDYYGGNTFDIGEIDPTIVGVLSKFPIATFYGFFGPTLLDVNNPVMLFSALENTFLLFLTIAVFAFRSPLETIRKLMSNPFFSFCLLFCLFLGFAIGFTT